ncbi:molybdenum cofactor guanylyltransferase [Paenibacillus abyssi]|uniref:Probable molybdenum cofactor guanylyltransferase n=1 Tax=Paenibacillus abyssi TaxID=1340531 RepID=A0A917FN26_9BACL|nr:molybdenum cofactor guanylyltransferase [Paenibacillus abyssi]GGF92193.1 putative molybdenum cofactor guanylyltransferase [Paenibacillus abyssi]
MDKLPIHGLIIAGGNSTRMGSDKALLPIGGRPLLAHMVTGLHRLCQSVTISAGSEERIELYRKRLAECDTEGWQDVSFASDVYPGCGPLAGLQAGLAQMPEGYAFIIACDMPQISKSLLKRMLERADGEVDAVHAAGQPFHALVHTRAAAAAGQLLEQGDYRFMRLMSQLKTVTVEPRTEAESQAFENLNTPEAYARYLRE